MTGGDEPWPEPRITDDVRRVVDGLPPLAPEQRERLAIILGQAHEAAVARRRGDAA